MVFNTEIQKPISNKVVLFEIDIGRGMDFWVSYAAGVYFCNFYDTYSKLISFPTVPDLPAITIVGSVIADGIQLQKVSSPQACIDLDSSFYWESATRALYIHCPRGDDPDLFTVRVGQVYGFRKGGETSYYGGVNFDDRLVDVPNISLNKDAQFWGVIAFDSNNVSIVNSDAEYDNLTRDNYVFGAKARLLAGFDGWDITDFEQIYEGFINKITTNEESVNFEIKDERSRLSRDIPSNVFSTAVYPTLKTNDIGKPIPRIFGTCRNVPVYIVDEGRGTAVTGHYHGKLCDTEYTTAMNQISAIYINGVEWTSLSTGTNLNTKTITLTTWVNATSRGYKKGDKVTADVTGEEDENGAVITNGGKIIRRLFKDYYGFEFTGDIYNLARWEEAQARDICLYINERKPIIDVIGDICNEGIQADFFMNAEGKYALRVYNENNAVVQTITRAEMLKTPVIEDNPEKILTSIAVGYNKDWSNKEYQVSIDDDDEETIFDQFGVYRQKEFDTLCVDITNAQDFVDTLKIFSSDLETLIKIEVPGWICITREIGDLIYIYPDRPCREIYGKTKCEIIGIEKNLNDHIISLTCRMIERVDMIPYTQAWYYTDDMAESQGAANNYYGNKYYGKTINEA